MYVGFPGGSAVKNQPEMQELQETQIQSLGWEDPLEEGMATQASILSWRIPWTEEPSRLQSIESQRVSWTRLKQLSMNAHVCMYVYVYIYIYILYIYIERERRETSDKATSEPASAHLYGVD